MKIEWAVSRLGAALGVAGPHGGSTPGPAIALGVLAGLLAGACAVWGLCRWLAYEPRWGPELGHAIAEAGLRCSETLRELLDWARLSR